MSDCIHQNLTTETYSLSGPGSVYIVRCSVCRTAIGVVHRNLESEFRNMEHSVRDIQNNVQAMYSHVMTLR